MLFDLLMDTESARMFDYMGFMYPVEGDILILPRLLFFAVF
jgi:hypothetical protein